ncbi:MAG TPA: hypothetical protein ENG40_00185 [Thermoprotei archaeon]|nr:hypothetical protein [Thermoprotei archaeon]
MPIKVSLVGHISIDTIIHEGKVQKSVGGTVIYGSLATLKHGIKPYIISKVGRDFSDEYFIKLNRMGIDLSGLRVVSSRTTSFKLKYKNGQRDLYLLSRCDDIFPEDINVDKIKNGVVIIGPIVGEVPLSTVKLISNHATLTVIDIQGYIRNIDLDNKVLLKSTPTALSVIKYADILHAEIYEASVLLGINDPIKAAKSIINLGAGIVLITLGEEGSYVVSKSEALYVPIVDAKTIDRTGCGDVYTTVFAIEYQRTGDMYFAAAMATTASAYLSEGIGPKGLQPRWRVKRKAEEIIDKIKPIEELEKE